MQCFLRTAAQLFSEVRERQDAQIAMSYVEIYNEKVRDLIGGKQNFQDVKITSTKNKEILIDGITTLPIEDFRSFSRFFKDANEKRSVASTTCNSESSRSHAILTFQISMKVIHDGVATSKFSKIRFVITLKLRLLISLPCFDYSRIRHYYVIFDTLFLFYYFQFDRFGRL